MARSAAPGSSREKEYDLRTWLGVIRASCGDQSEVELIRVMVS